MSSWPYDAHPPVVHTISIYPSICRYLHTMCVSIFLYLSIDIYLSIYRYTLHTKCVCISISVCIDYIHTHPWQEQHSAPVT